MPDQTSPRCEGFMAPLHHTSSLVEFPHNSRSGMLSPRTGLGLEVQKTGLGLGLGLDGNGLGLETLRPRPRVIRPRGLVYCNVLILYSVAKTCQFQVNIGNCYCKVSYHNNQGRQRR